MNDNIFAGTSDMIVIAVAVCLIVLAAMCIDLGSGLYKAKQRNEIRTSWGLKRTMIKFITYEGGIMIALGVDLLMHFCHFWTVVHLNLISGVPVVTCLVGIFLLIVEWLSVLEKADEKTKTEFSRAGIMASQVIKKEDLAEILAELLKQSMKEKTNETTEADG